MYSPIKPIDLNRIEHLEFYNFNFQKFWLITERRVTSKIN